MRIIVVSIVSLIVILYGVVMHSLINSQSLRETELRDALSVSISQTMEEVMGDGYGMDSKETVVAAFLQGLFQKINSNVDLTVNILELDLDEGLFDVEVIAAYEDIKGQQKEYSIRRTMISE